MSSPNDQVELYLALRHLATLVHERGGRVDPLALKNALILEPNVDDDDETFSPQRQHQQPQQPEKQPSLCAVYTAWLWMFRGIVGAHHSIRGDDRLAFMYITSGGIVGMGFILDLFFIPLQSNGVHRPSFAVRWLRLWYSFTYAKLASAAVYYVLRDSSPVPIRALQRLVAVAALVIAGELNLTFGAMVAAIGWTTATTATSFSLSNNDDDTFIFVIFVFSSLWRFLFGSRFGVGYNFPYLRDEPDSRKLGRFMNFLLRVLQPIACLAWIALFMLYAATVGWNDMMRDFQENPHYGWLQSLVLRKGDENEGSGT